MKNNLQVRSAFHTMNYSKTNVQNLLSLALFQYDEMPIVRKKKIEYLNVPVSFDIETSSFYDKGEKTAIMYIWQLGINHHVIYGRTWLEFIECMKIIRDELSLSAENRRMVIYVHNLGYEFQFIREYFMWCDEMVALQMRKPIKAVTTDGFEFRCSYLLSGYSLAKVGDTLEKYKVAKMVGDLDYSLIRHSETPLTDAELGYCINDVRVVMSYIQECIEKEGDITKIPLTKTGYVRRYCRNACVANKRDKKANYKYRRIISELTIDTPDEYKMLKQAFQGGFTHANPAYVGKVMHNVKSYDFTSSYPTVMIAEQFPMSKGEFVEITNKSMFINCLKNYCCVFSIELHNVKPILSQDNYISASRCATLSNPVIANGRVVSADLLTITITNVDFEIIRKFYTWDSMNIGKFIRYRKDFLPTSFVKSILKLYEDKTILKGIAERESEYNVSKAMLNATYGMTVTDIIRDEIKFSDDWIKEHTDINDALAKYNDDKSRFLFYPWGVFITAYARMNLFSGIINAGDDYVYSDTDSIKIINSEKHNDYIKRYNDFIINKLKYAMRAHGLDESAIAPKTIKGVEKPLGVWDDEGIYTRFKTLGAKRYMVEKNNKVNITVSGLNKKITVPYILEHSTDAFDFFTDNMVIPVGYTGKMTHTYIDDEKTGVITDYLGNTIRYYERTAIHMENAPYKMELSDIFKSYIEDIQGRAIYD